MKNEKKEKSERRCHQDIWTKVLFFFNYCVWILIVGILIVIEMARPQFETFFDRFYKLNLRTSWDTEVFIYLYYLVITGLIISTAGFVLTLGRARRKSDGNCISLLIMWLISITGLAVIKLFLL
ncbi:MAG: hypothetical protein U9N77_12780 [Thermodesulfobacteriota bacterium]|nr:hypothetical protein [Thermodesulfobacteriota bacterium]